MLRRPIDITFRCPKCENEREWEIAYSNGKVWLTCLGKLRDNTGIAGTNSCPYSEYLSEVGKQLRERAAKERRGY